MASSTIEEYLETIYKLTEEGPVRPARIAEAVGVSAPTVTATLKRLANAGYVTRPRGAVALTDRGRSAALEVIRRHRLAERFLVDVLGLPWDEVHEEACRLEHALSERVQAALEAYLENPAVCPHGHPIPSADGEVAADSGMPLSELDVGAEATIARITDEDGSLLAYLGSLGLYPGTHVRLLEVAPFRGPVMVEVGTARYAIGRDVAAAIIVTPVASARS